MRSPASPRLGQGLHWPAVEGPRIGDEAVGGPRRGVVVWERVRGLMLAVVLLLPLAACTPFDDVMVAIFGRSMRDQSSFDPYENPLPPPEGSVPFSAGNFTAGPGQINVGQPDAGVEQPPVFTQLDVAQQSERVTGLVNPVPATAESLARGRILYDRYCAPCHGENGMGATAYIAEVHPLLPAYNLALDPVRGYADGVIYGIMRVGRGLMPPYGHQISHYDRWHVVNYIRRLQGIVPEGGVAADAAGAANVDASGAADAGDQAAGERD